MKFITIIQADGIEQQLTESALPLVIGSGSGTHIRISGVASSIGYIGEDQGHLFIQPADGQGSELFHNDRCLSSSAWLKSGDQLRCNRALLTYKVSGDRIMITVRELVTPPVQDIIQPPQEPPPGKHLSGSASQDILPVHIDENVVSPTQKKIVTSLAAGMFLLLVLAVFFVLAARPLYLNITPEPDSVSISGFPPIIRFGARYLGIPGTYHTSITKEGYVPFVSDIAITGDPETKLVISLEKLPGILNLSITPPGEASVYSGVQFIGTTPPNLLEIEPGHHNLKIIRERYLPFETEIDIEGAGKTQGLHVQLKPDWAKISLITEPERAQVTVDDRYSGITPIALDLSSGTHVIILKKELYSESILDITVSAGMPQTHNVVLEPLPAKVSFTTTPKKAAVSIDKIYKGTAPLSILLGSRKPHEIVIAAPGHKSARQVISLAPGDERELDITLEQEQGVVFLTTTPPEANISINGTHYTNTQGRLNLPAASQTIEVTAPGYEPVTRTIVPKVGFSQQITIDLRPSPSRVSKTSAQETGPQSVKTAAGQDLLLVQPSAFTMGAPRRESGRRANERQRPVLMKKSYYLASKPVTNQEFRRFDRRHTAGMIAGHSLDSDNQPVVNISWEDAARYLNWLSLQDHLQPFYVKKENSFVPAEPLTNGYRLPTEAEWAFAARELGGVKDRRFPWTGTFPPREVTGNYADESARSFLPAIIQGYNDSFPVSSPVGSFPPNSGGFFDMGGNIAEWCHDYYSASTSSLSNQADPFGPPSGTHRVIRGSSYRDASVTELRLSYRAYHREARDNVGFRIARYP